MAGIRPVLTFTDTQVLAWVTPILWPFIRVLALFSAVPVIAQRAVPTRFRIGLAFLVAFCAQASIPAVEPIELASAAGFLAVVQQVLIGVSLGFAVRIVFAAVEFAGEIIGLQMGLNFAAFFNPMSGGQETAVSRFFGVTVAWLFIVIGGHLMLIAAIVQSFNAFPVSSDPFLFLRQVSPGNGAPTSSPPACGSPCRWWPCCSSRTWCSASSPAWRSR